jgi:hypothetical protein
VFGGGWVDQEGPVGHCPKHAQFSASQDVGLLSSVQLKVPRSTPLFVVSTGYFLPRDILYAHAMGLSLKTRWGGGVVCGGSGGNCEVDMVSASSLSRLMIRFFLCDLSKL